MRTIVTDRHTHTHRETDKLIGKRGLDGLLDLVVIHSAASAKGPGVNFPVARAYLRFNYRASTLAGKQCLAMRCTVATNCDGIMQCS